METAPLPPNPQPHPYDTEGDVSGPLSIGVEVSLVLANIFPILVVCKIKHPKDRIPGDEIILALSVTDILSVVVPSPLGLAAYFGQHWYGGERACDFYQVTINWFQLASMCMVTYLCIDRCLALRRTMAFKPQISNLNRTRILIFLIYVFTLIISCLPLVGLAPVGLSPSGCLCRSVLLAPTRISLEKIFSIVFLVVGFLNLTIAIIVNSNVVYRLWRFKRDFGARSADRRMNNICADVDRRSVVEMTIMTLVVTLVFYLAWMPVLVLLVLWKVGIHLDMPAVLYALLSTTLTGLLNPVIYAIFSRTYRHGYKRLLTQLTYFLCPCTRPRKDVISGGWRTIVPDISSSSHSKPPGGANSDQVLPSFLPGELHDGSSEPDAVTACYENTSLDCYLRLSVTEHMYALPAPPWAKKNRKLPVSSLTSSGSTAGGGSTSPGHCRLCNSSSIAGSKTLAPVAFIKGGGDGGESCPHNTEECQIHDSLLEQETDLAMTNKGFFSSKLCLINTESEDSDSDDIDTTTDYTPSTPSSRRPDGYGAAPLQESII